MTVLKTIPWRRAEYVRTKQDEGSLDSRIEQSGAFTGTGYLHPVHLLGIGIKSHTLAH